MATVQEMRERIRQSINTAYPEPEAGSIAQLVLEAVLQQNRIDLTLNTNKDVTAAQEQQVLKAISRLQKHEPVQYVLGLAHFYDLELYVDERVLIPRPETEELVHLVIKEHKHAQNLRILDICTGSGCIPLALAANLHTSEVYGLEISEGALEVAKINAAKYKLPVTWLQQDVFEPIESINPGSLDIITSNPPYVLEEEKQLMRENVLDFEPHLALFVPDTEPLKYYTRIAKAGFGLLRAGGKLYFEINERYGDAVRTALLQAGFAEAVIIQDMFDKERIVRAVK
ncbi:peptide chain release factor N(5)-glutamine methyltransferase [Pontibacter arcticus]|uniref:Release factor glutamine methyltransferase n=1 Tax=Pontibacter arcticus TaxID=2080288 RepID=A0A364RIM4_9BACT|nr:peptide chain release factor N(5)-glutamine methyltransferase [Pontibacter arcticus]RAU84152.1 peptide chain release factor N(5)-glutamine methyltransferase [Pontibacter arcticus]